VLVEYFEPDEVILEQGRTAHKFLYIVESGFVRLLDTQTQRLIRECGEGKVFGGHGLIEGGALPYEARTVEPTVCILLRAERFRELYAARRDFAAFFDSDLSKHRARQLPLDVSSARLLFGTRLGDLVHRQPVVCDPGAIAREAVTIMSRESVDSAVIVRDGRVVGSSPTWSCVIGLSRRPPRSRLQSGS
jgi:CBS domain-containing protein